jgi:hypothetical protein
MTRRALLQTIACTVAAGGGVTAADLRDETRRAYDEYAARAAQRFVERVRNGSANKPAARSARDDDVFVSPASEDGILSIPDGLVHHWIGSNLIRDVSLQDALDISYDYDNYRTIYKPVIGSRLLGHDGNTFRVRLRIKESSGGLSATLDVTSRVEYHYPGDREVYSIATSDEIREIRDAGTANERSLPAGHDSGYLWRAATFNNLTARDGGVFVETEALGLSRRFPHFLALFIEPIARRLGRASVERSLGEFSQAVAAHARRRGKNG